MKYYTAEQVIVEVQGILERHKEWLAGKEGGVRAVLTKADLRGVCLAGVCLTRADLAGADLAGADLRDADFWNADLRYADLAGACLRGADLRYADLTGAVLAGADLAGANLKEADLRGANLSCAGLSGACLSRADLTGAGINWQSHQLVSEILFRAASGDIERERWAAWIRLRTDLCWDQFIQEIPSAMVEWGISVLSPWVTDEYNAPAILRAAINAAEAAEEDEDGR